MMGQPLGNLLNVILDPIMILGFGWNIAGAAIAAMGVAMKAATITGMISMGLGQGVQPLLGYCVGAKMWTRFKKVLKFSL